jgi:hypothetical protein
MMFGAATAAMRTLALAAAFAFTAACAAAPEPDARLQSWSGKLDLKASGEDVSAISAAFAAEIANRFGPRPGAESVKADLEKQGFICRDVPPVEARTDYLVAACERPKPRGFCADLFVVSLRFAGSSRALDPTRVRPDASFERTCSRIGGG